MSDMQQFEQQPQDGRQTDIGGQQEDEEGIAPWEMIDRIAEKGVSGSDIKKLKDAGFTTTKSVLWTQKKKMMDIKGISEAKIDKILEACRGFEGQSFVTGTDLLQKRKEIIKCEYYLCNSS
jgi:hypothetical protein